MFKALLKTRMAAFGTWLFLRNNTQSNMHNSKLKIVGFAALMLYACAAFMVMFGVYFQQIAKPFFSFGIGWLYFTLFALAAFALMFIGGIFMAKSQLYEARDNDLLLSMPIPPRLILASRMVMLMIMNFFFELLVAIPAAIMWFRATQVTAISFISFLLIVLALPFFAMAVSGLFGWLLAISTGRVRKKSLMTVVFSVVFLGLYFVGFSRINIYIQQLISNGKEIAGSLGSVAPLYWIGNCVTEPNALQLVYSFLIMLVPFVLMYYILSATLIKVITSKRGVAKVKYEERAMQSSSISSALFRRELKRLLSSPVYILNAGLGVIFIAVAAVALVIKKSYILELVAQTGFDSGTVIAAVIFGLCLMSSVVLFTAPSVSLEGKTIWIVKSLPLSEQEILKAKLKLHIYLSIPSTILAASAAAYVFNPSVEKVLIMLLTPVLYLMFSANIGLICNLKSPNLDWVNETQVVKQSVSVLLAMLFNFLSVLIPGGLYFLLRPEGTLVVAYLLGYTLLLLLGWSFSQKWIFTKGANIF
ncbi:MAG: hypothetical protein KBI01_01885 [Oscillospiraceae bacterium]|nr:hypothetical protein [Oscillospiraceae bacterium]